MTRTIRSMFLLPLLALLLVLVPALLLSWVVATPTAAGQTVPPPTGTVVPTPRPTRPPARPTPTPAQPAAVDLRVRANGTLLKKVIGDRLSDTIYGYLQNGRLVRTDDNAAAWALVTSRPQVDDFLMSAADPDLLYAGGPLACFEEDAEAQPFARSENGGVTFMETAAGPVDEPGLQPMILHPRDELTLIAAGCAGLYESFDGGESWSVLSRVGVDGIPDGFVVQKIVAAYAAADPETPGLDHLYAVAVDESESGIVLYSDDEGRTWEVITPDMGDISFHISALTADPETLGRAWFAANNGIWSTEDLGQFWGFSNRGIGRDVKLTDLVLHPRELLLLGTSQGLYGKGTAVTRWSALGDSTFQSLKIDSLLFTDSFANRLWINAETGVYVYTVR